MTRWFHVFRNGYIRKLPSQEPRQLPKQLPNPHPNGRLWSGNTAAAQSHCGWLWALSSWACQAASFPTLGTPWSWPCTPLSWQMGLTWLWIPGDPGSGVMHLIGPDKPHGLLGQWVLGSFFVHVNSQYIQSFENGHKVSHKKRVDTVWVLPDMKLFCNSFIG